MKRRDKLMPEHDHDPYKKRMKLSEPSACSGCRAVYRAGRWQWATPSPDAKEVLCPACQRGRDNYPAGSLTLKGAFELQHREEILGLVRNLELREAREHPLKRIMSIVESEDGVVIETTDAKLARSIGTALHRAYEGELDYHYPGEGDVLRVRWSREE